MTAAGEIGFRSQARVPRGQVGGGWTLQMSDHSDGCVRDS